MMTHFADTYTMCLAQGLRGLIIEYFMNLLDLLLSVQLGIATGGLRHFH